MNVIYFGPKTYWAKRNTKKLSEIGDLEKLIRYCILKWIIGNRTAREHSMTAFVLYKTGCMKRFEAPRSFIKSEYEKYDKRSLE